MLEFGGKAALQDSNLKGYLCLVKRWRICSYQWNLNRFGDTGQEVSRVLGGGLVPGSLILVGGDPGVGKSTLLLQVAGLIAQGPKTEGPGPVLYVSGEESVEQISNRADRLNIVAEDLFLYSATDLEIVADSRSSEAFVALRLLFI